jgi:protein gp37
MTKIEWARKTWNPITGCSKISEGCLNCYAERMSKRLAGRFGYRTDEPFRVTFHPGRIDDPIYWRKPSKIFVCSMGDIFHDDSRFEWIETVFQKMKEAGRHTYILLTKRPKNIIRYLEWRERKGTRTFATLTEWPENIWIGVTAENQAQADKRIPTLLQVPAAVRLVSVEPCLEEMDLHSYLPPTLFRNTIGSDGKINWVICGCETGPGARPMKEDWARDIYGQCEAVGVPFFFKKLRPGKGDDVRRLDGEIVEQWPGEVPG